MTGDPFLWLIRFVKITEPAKFPNYGYMTRQHFDCALDSWIEHWSTRHYIGWEAGNSDTPATVLSGSDIAQKRLILLRNDERRQFIYNNVLFGHRRSIGTLINECKHGWINLHNCQNCKRSLKLGYLQTCLFLIHYNDAHWHLTEKDANPDQELAKEIQEIFSELRFLTRFRRDNIKDIRRPIINIKDEMDNVRNWESKFITQLNVDTITKRWTPRNDSILLKYLLVTSGWVNTSGSHSRDNPKSFSGHNWDPENWEFKWSVEQK